MLKTALLGCKFDLQNVQKLLTLTQSMTQFTKWQETKHVTEKHSKAC